MDVSDAVKTKMLKTVTNNNNKPNKTNKKQQIEKRKMTMNWRNKV